ncbi:14942_t:CDS:2 [Funneliformis geosporum]|uniref:1928_t:CDS:1 n=1 Tax=Funneliformis geosporum TaxID=1117311 RepID=A0A9W4WWC0_9GLOM|nr:14942_t:CDS:2 [Funneliformis geosporum]CAI2177031.1 1928_t:CDS:2 [Funneliformis geosporum]
MNNIIPSKKREHPVELEIDQLVTERAKKRYVSEFLSSELTALSLHGGLESGGLSNNNSVEQEENGTMELDSDHESQVSQGKKITTSFTRRKHVVMVTDLDAETDSEQSEEEKTTSFEIPIEIRKSLKKIPKELLGNKSRIKEMVHERRISDIMENGKLSPIPEDPTSPVVEMEMDLDASLECEINKNYEAYSAEDDENVMEL